MLEINKSLRDHSNPHVRNQSIASLAREPLKEVIPNSNRRQTTIDSHALSLSYSQKKIPCADEPANGNTSAELRRINLTLPHRQNIK